MSASEIKTGLRVLVVEDELLIADYIALLLEDAGHTVLGPAGTASDALQLLGDGAAADAAVLDIKLPGDMDGIALAVEIARQHGPLPVIFASGSGDPTTRRRAEALAPLCFLQKPFDPATLLGALSEVAAKHHQR